MPKVPSSKRPPLAKNRFANLDLNLLKVFKVLFEEQNMRKAADRLFVSQPAVSQSLQKLRFQFDDQLFVKVKTGLAPTPKAEQLSEQLLPLLYGVESVVNAMDVFEPKELDEEITIALSPSFVFSLSGEIYRFFQQHAPKLKVKVIAWNEHTIHGLEKGDILVGINAELADSYPSLCHVKVSDIAGCILVRKNHPIVDSPITVENMSQYPLARLLVSDYSKLTSPIVRIFDKQGFNLEVGFSSEYPLVLLDVVRHSDMFMGASNCFPIQDYPELVMLKPDQSIPETQYSAYSYFHTRYQNSEMIHWLNNSISNIFKASQS
ncbi:LysR family transcriptional regulator [Vibrio hangzhouensis]|uniref:DNA-binding transcriptional regulator, LysR family n=1 Tax=Vibrio hangzhouensis TaxID=462991 RepID=A0A1H5VDM1_9VIBR|nr:LysR family transcriptional regulator [Vibrio hangzhouensis]SEF85186.1 DNA-binding transcriptional regulator, LysR family [Vibrio hangzhouensis]